MEPFDAAKYERLMNGLEAVEMKFLKVFEPFNKGRMESEFFIKNFKDLEDKIKVKPWKFLSEIAFITDGEHGNIETGSSGFAKYYGARNVLKGILDETSGEFIGETDHLRC